MEQAPAQVTELVANLDDTTGEIVGQAVEALLGAGALDVWTTAITMKRNRPAVMLSVLCHADVADDMADRMIELTGTFGVRRRTWQRTVLDRTHATVATPFGSLRIKVGSRHGRPVVAKCEFADAEAAAHQHGVAVRRVIEAAKAAADRWLAEQEDAGA